METEHKAICSEISDRRSTGNLAVHRRNTVHWKRWSMETEHKAICSDISMNPSTETPAVHHGNIVMEVKPISKSQERKPPEVDTERGDTGRGDTRRGDTGRGDAGRGEPAPKKQSEAPRRIGPQDFGPRRSLSKGMSVLFMCFGVITFISIITGLALFFRERSVLHSQMEDIRKIRSPPPLPEGPKVAFSATLREGQEVTLGPYPAFHILVYKNVFTNIGNGYNASTGIFSAPLRGVYHFSFTAFGWGTKIASGVLLHHNDEFLMGNYDNNPGPGRGAINMATLQLEVGDTIYMGLSVGRRLHVTVRNYNVFSGYLVYAI